MRADKQKPDCPYGEEDPRTAMGEGLPAGAHSQQGGQKQTPQAESGMARPGPGGVLNVLDCRHRPRQR